MLPLLAVSLVAFRITIKKNNNTSQDPHITISGLVMENSNYKPLSNVRFLDSASKTEGSTDERGFYNLSIPLSYYPYRITLIFSKAGYKNVKCKTWISSSKKATKTIDLAFIGMIPGKADDKIETGFILYKSLQVETGQQVTYDIVAKHFDPEKQTQSIKEGRYVQNQVTGSKPYLVVNGHTYLINATGGTASVDTITDIVFVDGRQTTGKEVNEKLKRSRINTVGAMDKEAAVKKYGINQAVMEISVDSR